MCGVILSGTSPKVYGKHGEKWGFLWGSFEAKNTSDVIAYEVPVRCGGRNAESQTLHMI
jgi:hypothetical protein